MKELMENLWVRNSTVKRAERMMRGVEKKETETILTEFEESILPNQVYFRFLKV